MRFPSLAFVAFLLAACGQSASAPSESGILTGVWRTAPVPSGSAMVLTLDHAEPLITGIGQDFGIDPAPPVDVAVVFGAYADSTVELRLQYRKAGVLRFTGTLDGPDILKGTWVYPAPVKPPPVTFYRQPIRR